MSHEDVYLAGYNDGYYLAAHAPLIAEELAKVPGNDPYVLALHEGIAEKALEQEAEQLKDLHDLRANDEYEQEQDR